MFQGKSLFINNEKASVVVIVYTYYMQQAMQISQPCTDIKYVIWLSTLEPYILYMHDYT